jgi:hypothetical protein
MTTVRVSGAINVGAELRAMADRIESSMPGIEMVVQYPEEASDSTLLVVRFTHPEPQRWHVTELLSALSRPGD